MSRWKHLDDWPAKLQTMTLEELTAERKLWSERGVTLGHREARAGARKRARLVEAAMRERFDVDP